MSSYVTVNMQCSLGHRLLSLLTSVHIKLYPHCTCSPCSMLCRNNFVALLLGLS